MQFLLIDIFLFQFFLQETPLLNDTEREEKEDNLYLQKMSGLTMH